MLGVLSHPKDQQELVAWGFCLGGHTCSSCHPTLSYTLCFMSLHAPSLMTSHPGHACPLRDPDCLRNILPPALCLFPRSLSGLCSSPVSFTREVSAGSGMLGRSAADGAKGLVEPGRSGDLGRLGTVGLLEGSTWLTWGISPTPKVRRHVKTIRKLFRDALGSSLCQSNCTV